MPNARPVPSRSHTPVARIVSRVRSLLTRLFRASPPLTIVGVVMVGAAVAAAVGMAVDPREITGAPAWLKPFKFAVSTAIYSFTAAGIFAALPEWRRVRRIVGGVTAAVFVLEVAIIAVQAWRGTASHFNVSTPFDAVLFSTMGTAILLQTGTSAAVLVALWRQRFADQPFGWALRIGMAVTIAGALTGGLMTRPTQAQLADARATGRMTTTGSHTVGAADGGPGVPITGWSRDHGDLRVPHFVGLHAVQGLALVAFAIRRWRRPEAARVRMVLVASASYTAMFVLLLWQALRDQSLAAPDATTLAWLTAWFALTVFGVAIAVMPNPRFLRVRHAHR